MYNIKKLNAISGVVYKYLPKENYNISDDVEDADAFLVRSADCHSIDFPEKLAAIARAGAGVSNIPLDKCTKEGIVAVSYTHLDVYKRQFLHRPKAFRI